MSLWDYVAHVIYEVEKAGEINQTDLTEKVWGTSGRGNTTLTQKMFPSLVTLGYLRMNRRGRAKMFSLASESITKVEQVCQKYHNMTWIDYKAMQIKADADYAKMKAQVVADHAAMMAKKA